MASYIQQENGYYLLQEDGSRILLENQNKAHMKIRITNVTPKTNLQRTEAAVENPGITYNETGFSYNQAGVAYGGLYGNDITQIINLAQLQKPRVAIFSEVGGTQISHGTVVLDRGMLIGILGMTYPESGTIIT